MNERLPNGLTHEQDAAFDRLAQAIADHLEIEDDCPGCMFHPEATR